jgi:hypothetical protein
MSYKKFSSAHGAPSKTSPGDKSKDAPTADQPATQPDKTPTDVRPARRSWPQALSVLAAMR